MARPTCLYCGAALPEAAVSAAAASAALVASGPPAPAAPARILLVVDPRSVPAATLGVALGLTPYEAALWHRRGGYSLEEVLGPVEAEAEAARLRAAGLVVFLVPEALARAEPWLAVAGVREKDGLRLRGTSGFRVVSGPELLLVVKGPIVRAYPVPLEPRKVQTNTRLDDGYRFHLHLRGSPPVLELDPGDFDFGERARFASSELEMNDWLESLAAGVPVDDAFRHETPALGPGTGPSGPLAATGALSRRAAKGRRTSEATVHDNLRQFRFYSAWRGAVERARVGAA
jgi:hypothetical protein